MLSLGTGDSSSPLVYCSKGCRKQGIVKPQIFDSPANKSSASGQGCGPGLKSLDMGSSLPTVLATDELPDELFQLFLAIPAGKGRGQVEHGACGAGHLLQHLSRREGL